MPQPRVILIMGVSGSGKTTLGAALAAKLGWHFDDADAFHPAANIAKMRHGQALSDDDRAPWLAALRQHLARRFARGERSVLACSALKKSYRQQLLRGLAEHADADAATNADATANTAADAHSGTHSASFGAAPNSRDGDSSTNSASADDATVGLVCLHGSRELLAARLAARDHAFMPPSLLDSQLAALEIPDDGDLRSTPGGSPNARKTNCTRTPLPPPPPLHLDIAQPIPALVDQVCHHFALHTYS